MKLRSLISAISVLLAATAVNAQNLKKEVKSIVLQSSLASGNLNLGFDVPKFDTRKGTLISVQIKVSGLVQYTISGEFINGQSQANNFIGMLRSNFQLLDFNNTVVARYEKMYTDSVENYKSQGSASVNSEIMPFAFEKAYFNTSEVMPFISGIGGSGPLRFTLNSNGNASVTAFNGTNRVGASARSQSSVSIIYNYISYSAAEK